MIRKLLAWLVAHKPKPTDYRIPIGLVTREVLATLDCEYGSAGDAAHVVWRHDSSEWLWTLEDYHTKRVLPEIEKAMTGRSRIPDDFSGGAIVASDQMEHKGWRVTAELIEGRGEQFISLWLQPLAHAA